MNPPSLADHTRIDTNEWPYSIKFHDFATFLGLPADKDSKGIYWRGDQDTANKVEQIYSWAKASSKSDDHTAIKTQVKKLQRHLGTNMQGKSLVDTLWQYTRMNTEMNYLEENIKALGGEVKREEPKRNWKTQHTKNYPKINRIDVSSQVKKATDQVRKQVAQQTQKAIKDAIQQGIKEAFR